MADEPILITAAEPEAAIPTLWEGPALDLPTGAVRNPDGSVSVALAHPFDLDYRQAGNVIRSEPVTHVTLHRMTGEDVLKITRAKDRERAAMIAALRITPARYELWSQKMDARDESMIGAVVAELMGAGQAGLPDQARDEGDTVALTLMIPATDDQGTVWSEIRFPTLTVAARRRIGEAEEPLVSFVQHGTGLTPKSAKALVHAMDAADAAAVIRVRGFLS